MELEKRKKEWDLLKKTFGDDLKKEIEKFRKKEIYFLELLKFPERIKYKELVEKIDFTSGLISAQKFELEKKMIEELSDDLIYFRSLNIRGKTLTKERVINKKIFNEENYNKQSATQKKIFIKAKLFILFFKNGK